MPEPDSNSNLVANDYDPGLAARIKSILREDDTDALPNKLESEIEIQLLSDEIMKGGLGRVGRYWDDELEREVAVKFIHQGLESTHGKRFRREIMITSSLDHPGVVPIYSIGQSGGQPFYTMRFVSGVTFEEAVQHFHRSVKNQLDRSNPQFRALLESFKSACATIGYAHAEKNVCHRDVKPQNIMIENGLTVVLDWGLAKRSSDHDADSSPPQEPTNGDGQAALTRADQYLGTPAYMAPEQALGTVEQIDNLTDIYGLGATLYELLTGCPPHRISGQDEQTRAASGSSRGLDLPRPGKPDLRRWLSEIAVAEPPSAREKNPSVPRELDSICRRAMARDKSQRYQSTQQIIDDIENWLVQSDVEAHQYSRIEVASRWIRKHTATTVVLCLASLLIAVISIVAFLFVSSAKQNAEDALAQMRIERVARINDQLSAFVSVPPVQAEVFLRELESYSDAELRAPIAQLVDHHNNPTARKRLQLIHLDRSPHKLISLMRSTDTGNVENLSLICSAIQSPENFHDPLLLERIWQLAHEPTTTLTAGVVLAKLAPKDSNWLALAPQMTARLVSVSPQQTTRWCELLSPVRAWLESPLMLRYQSDSRSLESEREISGRLLLEFFKQDQQALIKMVGAANSQMFAKLVGRLKQSPDTARNWIQELLQPPSRPGLFNGPQSVAKAINDANGMINDSFMICDSIPKSNFDEIQVELEKHGYRPTQVRKYSLKGQRFVSTIWVRDRRPFQVFADLQAVDVEPLLTKQRDQGWIPNDLSAERVSDQVLYTVVFHQDFSNRNRYRILLHNSLEDHQLKSNQLGQQYFQQLSYIEIVDERDSLLIAGLYRQDPGQRYNLSTAALSDDIDDRRLLRLKDYVPYSAFRGPRGVSSIWQDSRSLTGVIVAEPDAEKRHERWTELTQEGFVPVCVSTGGQHNSGLADSTFSIWNRRESPASDRANYAMALLHLEIESMVLTGLKRTRDQTLRTLLIHRLAAEKIPAARLLRWLQKTADPGIRSGILQALGQYRDQPFDDLFKNDLVATIRKLFVNDPDPGVHGAATWALKQFGQTTALKSDESEPQRSRDWFVDVNDQTMTTIDGPVRFSMGSRIPPTMHAASEAYHMRTIHRSFAIATHEVTWEQFARFSAVLPAGSTRFYSKTSTGKLNEQAPQYQVSWYRAAEYCNWLSEQAGYPEDQWCYVPGEDGKYGPGLKVPEDFLDRKGFRLPTEAEWEFAARGGTETERFFGRDVNKISYYGWHKGNSNISTQTVGTLKPNELGLFDVYGNVWEWCHGSRDDPWPDFLNDVVDMPSPVPLVNHHPRSLRGGSMVNPYGLLRSSVRSFNRPSNEQFTIGFRVARTLTSPNAKSQPETGQ